MLLEATGSWRPATDGGPQISHPFFKVEETTSITLAAKLLAPALTAGCAMFGNGEECQQNSNPETSECQDMFLFLKN